MAKTQSIQGGDASRKQSTEVQAKECREICKRFGYVIVPASKENEAYEEKDYSGRTYPTGYEQPDGAFEKYFNAHIARGNKRSRPKFGEMLNRIKNREVDMIVIRDVSRLIRPTRHSHLGNFLLQFLSEYGVQIHSMAEGLLDPDNFGNMITTNLQMMITDDAKQTELKKSLAGLKEKRDSGWLTGGASFYGFESGGHQKMNPVTKQLDTVRFIFKRFLEGVSILQVVRDLNDLHKIPTANNSTWTNKQVRNILVRPAYAGLSRNSAGRLIESRVFKQHAVVSESDFLAVARQLKTDREYLVTTDSAKLKQQERVTKSGHGRGGRPLGSSDRRGPCHPFTGLLRCGCCGKHLYVFKTINPYYDKPVPVFYYQCNSPIFSKSEQFDECKRVRLLESYPAEAAAQTKNPTGHGLIENLFPLLFSAYIQKHINESGTNKDLEKTRLALEEKITELQQEERTITNQYLPLLSQGDEYAQEQFDNLMSERRAEMKQFKEQYMAIREIQSDTGLDDVTVPEDYFTDPSKISMETLRALAHQTISLITVYPNKIEVALVDNQSLAIERVRNRNSRLLPFWRAVVDTPKISAKTKLSVTYFYKSTQLGIMTPITYLKKSANLDVLTVGNNNSVDSKRSEIERDPSPLAKLLEPLAKILPTHKRALHTNSSIFFPKKSGVGLTVAKK